MLLFPNLAFLSFLSFLPGFPLTFTMILTHPFFFFVAHSGCSPPLSSCKGVHPAPRVNQNGSPKLPLVTNSGPIQVLAFAQSGNGSSADLPLPMLQHFECRVSQRSGRRPQQHQCRLCPVARHPRKCKEANHESGCFESGKWFGRPQKGTKSAWDLLKQGLTWKTHNSSISQNRGSPTASIKHCPKQN